MKITPSLLQAIALGLWLPCLGACALNTDHHSSALQADSNVVPSKPGGGYADTLPVDSAGVNRVPDDFACPACGRG